MPPIESAGLWPWLAMSLTLLATVALPGLLLLLNLAPSQSVFKAKLLPLSFVLGLGLLSPLALLFIGWQLPLMALVGAIVILDIMLAVWRWGQTRRASRPLQLGSAPAIVPPHPLLLVATVLVSGLALLLFVSTMSSWSSGDLWYLQYIRTYVDAPAQTPFNWRASWWILQALLDYLSGVQPLDAFSFYLPPLLMIISLLAFYSLAVELFQNANTALLATLLQILFYLSSLNSHDWLGRGFFDRVVEDKFLIWLIILPVALLLAVRYVRSGNQRLLLPLVLSFSALTFVHPIGLVQGALAVGSFGLVHLIFNRRRQVLFQVLLVGVALPLIFVTVPWLQSLTIWGRQPGEAVEESRAFNYALGSSRNPGLVDLFQTRLWVQSATEDRYVSHPHLIAQPLSLLAILLTPLLLLDIRRSLAAQFLVSNMAATLLLLYTPGLTPLLGRLITPWLLYRLSYGLPVALTLAYVAEQVYYHLLARFLPPARRQTGFALFSLLLVAGLGWLLAGYMADGVSFLQERRTMALTPPARDLLDHLAGRIAPGEVVIARDDFITYLVPAFVPAKTLYGNAGYAPEARAAVARFYQTQLVSPATLDLLWQWQVDALIIERDTPLAFQLAGLPNLFVPLYENEQYALYRVRPNPPAEAVVQGNNAYLQGQFALAEAAYRQALAADLTHSAAQYGLGLTYQAQNQVEAAQDVLNQLLAARPNHLPARLALARLYQQAGRLEAAQTELEQAHALWPANLEAAERLGDVYLAQEQAERAVGAYTQAVLQPPLVAPGQYHLALADLYRRKGLETWAKTEFQTVIELDSLPAIGLRPGWLLGVRNSGANFRLGRLAQAHTALAHLQEQAGNPTAAETEYRQALTEVTNDQAAYTGLADLYRATNRPDEAINLYRLVSRRNNNAAWPHMALGQMYLNRFETEVTP